MDTLDEFKAAFLKRFKTIKCTSQKVRLLSNLKQASGETCLDFWDRVTNVVTEAFNRSLPGDATAEVTQGFNKAVGESITQYFIYGLLPTVRRQIEAKLDDLKTSQELLDTATQIEAAMLPSNSSVPVAAIEERDTQLESIRKELEALRIRGQGQGRGKGGGGRGGGSGSGPGRGGPRMTLKERIDNRKRWAFCCLLYTSPSPRDKRQSRMPSSA